MKSREIWLADLDPSQGFEQSGKRPVMIISGDTMNVNIGLAIICPLTSKIKNFIGDVILQPDEMNGLTHQSEILVFQVRTISSKRLVKKIGNVSTLIHDEVLKNLIKICKF